jgi:hypothetical protein
VAVKLDRPVAGKTPEEQGVLEQIGCEIVKLCRLGHEVEEAGLTKEDISHAERNFIIKPI